MTLACFGGTPDKLYESRCEVSLCVKCVLSMSILADHSISTQKYSVDKHYFLHICKREHKKYQKCYCRCITKSRFLTLSHHKCHKKHTYLSMNWYILNVFGGIRDQERQPFRRWFINLTCLRNLIKWIIYIYVVLSWVFSKVFNLLHS